MTSAHAQQKQSHFYLMSGYKITNEISHRRKREIKDKGERIYNERETGKRKCRTSRQKRQKNYTKVKYSLNKQIHTSLLYSQNITCTKERRKMNIKKVISRNAIRMKASKKRLLIKYSK